MPRPRPRLVTVTVSRTECSRSLVIMSVMRIQGHRLLLPTINNINIRYNYNPCFSRSPPTGGVNVLRKLNESISAGAGYMCGSVLGSALLAPSHDSWKVHHPDQTELWNQSMIMQLFGHSTFQFCTLGCIHEVSNLFGTFNLNVLSCHTNVIYFWKVQLHYVLFMKWKCLDNLNPMLDISTYLTYLLIVRIVFWWAITRLSWMMSANVSGVWFQMILFAVITTWHSYLDLHFSTSTADLLTPTRHGGRGDHQTS